MLVLLGMYLRAFGIVFISLPSAHNELWDESGSYVVIGMSRIIKMHPSLAPALEWIIVKLIMWTAEENRHMNVVASSGNFKLDAAANTHHHHLLRHQTWLEYHLSLSNTKPFEMYHTSLWYQAVTRHFHVGDDDGDALLPI